MPTYEYRCPDGHDFEKFTQKISNAQSELPCPSRKTGKENFPGRKSFCLLTARA